MFRQWKALSRLRARCGDACIPHSRSPPRFQFCHQQYQYRHQQQYGGANPTPYTTSEYEWMSIVTTLGLGSILAISTLLNLPVPSTDNINVNINTNDKDEYHLCYFSSHHNSITSLCQAATALHHPVAGFSTNPTTGSSSNNVTTINESTSTTSSSSSSSGTTNTSTFKLNDMYDIDTVLGEGAYGLVYRARRRADGKIVALKAMSRSLTGQTDFEREVAALQLLSKPPNGPHEHVVQLYDLHRDDDNYYLSMELIEGGELLEHLIDNGPYSEGLAASFMRQFAEAMCFVHSNGLAHADLKPENLLLTTSNDIERAKLKVADFGCARSHDLSRKDMHLPAQEFAIGCSFLHMVALGNQFELEKMLQERPHLVNFRDYDFRTPLHLAASEGHVDICRFLVSRGARVNRSDRWGGSPLDDAHRQRHPQVIAYLREHGATFGNKTQVRQSFPRIFVVIYSYIA